MQNIIKICIVGLSGRMGREIINSSLLDSSVEIVAGVEYKGSPNIGEPIIVGESKKSIPLFDDLLSVTPSFDLIIDFSGAAGTKANLEKYAKLSKPLIVGSTGIDEKTIDYLKKLSVNIPLIISSNMSLGINLLAKMVRKAAEVLGSEYDIEIFEAHHKHKKDAPSGTALTLGKAAAEGRGLDLNKAAVYSREGNTGERKTDTIGFQVLRGGNIPGTHTVYFCGETETIEFTHVAGDRKAFADGALKAAKWLYNKTPGQYTMDDVLGI